MSTKSELEIIHNNTITIREKIAISVLLMILKMFQPEDWSKNLREDIGEIKKLIGGGK